MYHKYLEWVVREHKHVCDWTVEFICCLAFLLLSTHVETWLGDMFDQIKYQNKTK